MISKDGLISQRVCTVRCHNRRYPCTITLICFSKPRRNCTREHLQFDLNRLHFLLITVFAPINPVIFYPVFDSHPSLFFRHETYIPDHGPHKFDLGMDNSKQIAYSRSNATGRVVRADALK